MSGERINSAIPSLINGVSQQPSTTRLGSQCEEQINGYSSVVDGLRKRPPLRHVARLMEGQHPDAFVHFINRDVNERYVSIVSGGDLRVFDILMGGAERAVAFPNGKAYLSAGMPRRDFAAVTVADHTFLANKTAKAAMASARTAKETNEAIVYVKRGFASTTYKVRVGGSWTAYTTPDAYTQASPTSSQTFSVDGASTTTTSGGTVTSVGTQPSTEVIAAYLAASISAVSGFTAEVLGSCVRIRRADGADFAFQVADSWGDEALVGIKREVKKKDDLPPRCWDGVKVRITGETKNRDDDVYYEFNSSGSTKNGIWEECRGWDQEYKIDAGTMPHRLVRESTGDFSFRHVAWEDAWVGDSESVANPSFIDQRISDIFFYRSRLGFIADENVILSRHGEFYDFWPKTATAVLATDPIDLSVSHIKVSILRHALPFKDSLLLFSDQTQFQLSDGGTAGLTPETVRVDLTTEIECSRWCKPAGAGRNVFFMVERGDNSAVREYKVARDDTGNDADDITAHVSRYIPKGVHTMIASSNEYVNMLLSSERPNEVYVYKYFYVNEEKAQASWSRWVLPESDRILSVHNIEADVYFVVQRPDGVYLDKCELQSIVPDEGLGFPVHLDRRVEVTGAYDPDTDTTTWTLPYTDTEPLTVVLGGGFKGRGGRIVSRTTQSGNTLTVRGDLSAHPCIVGRKYEFRYTFSEQYMRESKDVGAPVIKKGRLQLLGFTVLHHDSGYFRSEVTAKGRDTVTKEHLGTIGDLAFVVGKPVIDSEPHSFGVLSRSDSVKIEVVSEEIYPVNLQSAEWTGTFTADVRRV